MSSEHLPKLVQSRRGQNYLLIGTISLFVLVLLNFTSMNQHNDYESTYISFASEIQVLSQQIAISASVAAGGKLDALEELNTLRQGIQTNIDNLSSGRPDGTVPPSPPEVANSLRKVRQQFDNSKFNIDKILAVAPDLEAVQSTAGAIVSDSNALSERASELVTNYSRLSETRIFPSAAAGKFGAFVFLCLLALFSWTMIVGQRSAVRGTHDVNQRNQDAILRLMNEMGSLAEGDLTVKVTVTEDITGSIADLVNYVVESLRDLVTKINKTAQEVEASAQEIRATTTQLAESSSLQAVQVSGATDTIRNMSQSFDQMAKRSLESADVAQRSVEIANTGANKVQETIAGMDTIRGQIQETSKRIKRLGESSQEIGDIVELINGLAEQTNILALNAAIQAASAGGAGRGFAVVADEVQSLAERAANATRQIETLVETIQGDTAAAVSSMESTTSEVVQGARLAEDAGDALERIEQVSKDLSALIQSVATEAQSQSSVATEVTSMMTGIRDVSIQSAEGTTRTAESVGHLAELVSKLRESVADFKLPRR